MSQIGGIRGQRDVARAADATGVPWVLDVMAGKAVDAPEACGLEVGGERQVRSGACRRRRAGGSGLTVEQGEAVQQVGVCGGW